MPTGLDWVAGDKLGLPATNTDPYNSETVEVATYDANTGVVTLSEPLKGYHFGDSRSTGDEYNGVDMRGEVLLLSSNVNVTASTDAASMTNAYPHPFGCQILVSDFFEPGTMEYRAGAIKFDNVAVYNCSQEHTEYAALRFEQAQQGEKIVTNSAISSGLGEGIIIRNSAGLTLENNVIHDFILFGIHAATSSDLTVRGNVLNGVRNVNEEYPNYDRWEEPPGGMDFRGCSDFTVQDNIVASTWHHGFRLPGHACGAPNPHTGNVAHSIAGYGVIVYTGPAACTEFRQFAGYKNRRGDLHLGGGVGAAIHRVRDVTSIDSKVGVMALGAPAGRVEVSDSYFYGGRNMPNEDCPAGFDCTGCLERRGLMLPVFGEHQTETKKAPMKLTQMYAFGGSWGGTSLFKNLRFIGWDADLNACGAEQSAIGTDWEHPDYHPIAHFEDILFENTDESAMFKFDAPN